MQWLTEHEKTLTPTLLYLHVRYTVSLLHLMRTTIRSRLYILFHTVQEEVDGDNPVDDAPLMVIPDVVRLHVPPVNPPQPGPMPQGAPQVPIIISDDDGT